MAKAPGLKLPGKHAVANFTVDGTFESFTDWSDSSKAVKLRVLESPATTLAVSFLVHPTKLPKPPKPEKLPKGAKAAKSAKAPKAKGKSEKARGDRLMNRAE